MMLIRLFYHVTLDLHVLHDEVGAIERVGHYSSHERSRENDGVGVLLVEEFLHCQLVSEVEFLMCATYKIIVAALFQVIPNRRA